MADFNVAHVFSSKLAGNVGLPENENNLTPNKIRCVNHIEDKDKEVTKPASLTCNFAM